MIYEKEVLKMALCYCVDKGYGYYDDLVDEFRISGFIHIGFTRQRKIWSVTNFAQSYKRDLEW